MRQARAADFPCWKLSEAGDGVDKRRGASCAVSRRGCRGCALRLALHSLTARHVGADELVDSNADGASGSVLVVPLEIHRRQIAAHAAGLLGHEARHPRGICRPCVDDHAIAGLAVLEPECPVSQPSATAPVASAQPMKPRISRLSTTKQKWPRLI